MPTGGAQNAAGLEGPAAPRRRGRPPGGRAFDHDQARRMRATGMTYTRIGSELGVCANSVKSACTKPRTPDEQWRALEAWIDRRHGHAGTFTPGRIQMRNAAPRVSP